MRISDWSSDVCSSDLSAGTRKPLPILMECLRVFDLARESRALARGSLFQLAGFSLARSLSLSSSSEANMSSALSNRARPRSEEHTSELQSLMRISYAVFCLKKKKSQYHTSHHKM